MIAYILSKLIGNRVAMKETYQCLCSLLCWSLEKFGYCCCLFNVEVSMVFTEDYKFLDFQKSSRKAK